MASEPPFRPFRPGEKISNPDGSYSTEVTTTVDDGKGGYMVVPSLFMSKQGVIDFRNNPDAAGYAARLLRDQHGYQWPTFKNLEESEQWAVARSQGGGAGQGPLARPPGGFSVLMFNK